MSHENPNDITLEGLQRFLSRIGFDQPARTGNSLAFHHRESGAIIVLAIPDDGRSVRPADLLSVLTRLENHGIATEADIEQLKSGKLPMAS